MTEKKVDIIVDLQYGSTGKGLLAGYLSETGSYDCVINANMPNAGHTYIDAIGRRWVHKVLPNGIVGPKVKYCMIGPGSVFDPDRLMQEYDESIDLFKRGIRLMIHPEAAVLSPDHKHREAMAHNQISSTMQGSAAAMIEKIMRQPGSAILAKHYPHQYGGSSTSLNSRRWTKYVCSQQEWFETLAWSNNILIEGAQGYSLGLSAGFWPFCTSRECTPARFFSDCAVPIQWLRHTYGTMRTYPIRVGNTEGGHSGPVYMDQEELSWSDLGVEPELTTVTGRVRRVFNWSGIQTDDAMRACHPDFVFLNFCNYGPDSLIDRIKSWVYRTGQMIGNDCHVAFEGWGPTSLDIKEVSV